MRQGRVRSDLTGPEQSRGTAAARPTLLAGPGVRDATHRIEQRLATWTYPLPCL